MSEQPTALRLADLFELEDDLESQYRKAAAELRRLHAEVERLSLDSIHSCHSECQRPLCRLKRGRDALLEALRWTARALDHDHPAAIKARAVIKSVEGEGA